MSKMGMGAKKSLRGTANQQRSALDEIARIVAEATEEPPGGGRHGGRNGAMGRAHAGGGVGGREDTEPEAMLGCQIKPLPSRLWERAAEVAAKVNPVNAPVRELALTGTDISPAHLTLLTAKYWGPTPRVFSVSFMEHTPADLRARIVSHLNAWSRTACLSFEETSGIGEVRISRGPGGYWSYLGSDILLIPQDRPTMNLEGFDMGHPESEFKRVVRHEAGHTLGFPHEHMRRELVDRIDRQKAYRYFLATQGWDEATVDAQVLTPLDKATYIGTPADEDSIMCYQLPGQITTDGRPIRGGLDINATDYAFAGQVYPYVTSTSDDGGNGYEYAEEDDWDPADDVATPV